MNCYIKKIIYSKLILYKRIDIKDTLYRYKSQWYTYKKLRQTSTLYTHVRKTLEVHLKKNKEETSSYKYFRNKM